MIILKNKEDNKSYCFFVVDAHHHIGTDVDGHENSPTGPTGSYAFCRKILNGDGRSPGLAEVLDTSRYKYNWSLPYSKGARKDKILTYHPVMRRFSECDNGLAKKYSFEETLALDQIVVFPMHDKFRKKEDVEYKASNMLIHKWTETYPHSMRFIGYGRVNPKEDIEAAVNEMKRFVQENGLRGLKLHPTSEDFLMDSPHVKMILKEAAYLGIPVIFHTTYAHEVKALYNTANEILIDMIREYKEKYIPKLKIIIGHCTYQSEDVFLALSHPNIYGELSTLNKPETFLKMVAKKVDIRRYLKYGLPVLQEEYPGLDKKQLNSFFHNNLSGLKWTKKIMLGTDYPYMPVTHTIDLIKTLLERDTKLVLTPEDLQDLLGANILRLVPPKFSVMSAMESPEGENPRSHKEFIKGLLDQKRKIIGWDPILGRVTEVPLRFSNAILTVSESSEVNKSYLLSSYLLKSPTGSGLMKRYETIRNISKEDSYTEIIDKEACPDQVRDEATASEKFLDARMNSKLGG